MSKKGKERRQADRKPISAQIEFLVDAGEILQADGIDISETGLAFSASEPLTVSLVLTTEDDDITRRAKLVRVVQDDDDRFVFGLEFIPDEPL